jgi:hypothetical protein
MCWDWQICIFFFILKAFWAPNPKCLWVQILLKLGGGGRKEGCVDGEMGGCKCKWMDDPCLNWCMGGCVDAMWMCGWNGRYEGECMDWWVHGWEGECVVHGWKSFFFKPSRVVFFKLINRRKTWNRLLQTNKFRMVHIIDLQALYCYICC